MKVTLRSEGSLLIYSPISGEETLLCEKIKWAPKKRSEIQVRSEKNLSIRAFNPCSEFPIPGVFNTKILSHLFDSFKYCLEGWILAL